MANPLAATASDNRGGDDGWNEVAFGLPATCDEWLAEELAALLVSGTIHHERLGLNQLGGAEVRSESPVGTIPTLGALDGAKRAVVVYCRDEQVEPAISTVCALLGELTGETIVTAPRNSSTSTSGVRQPAELQVTRRPLPPGWRDRWKEFFTVQQLGRVVIRPSWLEHAPSADEIVVVLDPGQAFGTGTHASTRLVLRTLGQWPADGGPASEPARILDLGCGSGILAVAALLLWPRATALGIDVDPDALTVALDNSERNGVADRFAVDVAALGPGHGTFALVLANIQADVLRRLVGSIARATAVGGTVVLSGLLDAEAAELAALYQTALGAQRVETRSEQGWTAVVLWDCQHGLAGAPQ